MAYNDHFIQLFTAHGLNVDEQKERIGGSCMIPLCPNVMLLDFPYKVVEGMNDLEGLPEDRSKIFVQNRELSSMFLDFVHEKDHTLHAVKLAPLRAYFLLSFRMCSKMEKRMRMIGAESRTLVAVPQPVAFWDAGHPLALQSERGTRLAEQLGWILEGLAFLQEVAAPIPTEYKKESLYKLQREEEQYGLITGGKMGVRLLMPIIEWCKENKLATGDVISVLMSHGAIVAADEWASLGKGRSKSENYLEWFARCALLALKAAIDDKEIMVEIIDNRSRIEDGWTRKCENFYTHYIGDDLSGTVDYGLLCSQMERVYKQGARAVVSNILTNDGKVKSVWYDMPGVSTSTAKTLLDEWLKYLFVHTACAWTAGRTELSCPLSSLLSLWLGKEALNKGCQGLCGSEHGFTDGCTLSFTTRLNLGEIDSQRCLFWQTIKQFFADFKKVELLNEEK